MFKCKVVGMEKISFPDKTTGQKVEFNKVYVTFKNEGKNSIGEKAAEINTILPIENLQLGETYLFDYTVIPGMAKPKLVSITAEKKGA